MRLRVAVLGSTGSIGKQTLDVARKHADRIEIVALSANANAPLLMEQAREFGVEHIALAEESAAADAREAVRADDPFGDVGGGAEAVAQLTQLDGVDIVLNALVGAAGLKTTWLTLKAGRTLALANKESLVVGGELVMPLVAPGQLLPVDSEHSAIFQCYLGESADDVTRIWLTASGGPFRGKTRAELEGVTAAQALAHPTWTMGPKITIDSSTLMNKGLEVIEAHHLFGVDYDQIRVVVHPQSCIHSMIEFADGSVKAHLGATDMRIPIQYAFSQPRRWDAPLPPVDFTQIGRLDFSDPDYDTFGCLKLAFAAGREGGTAPAIMNAANEVAVAAFLGGRIHYLHIEAIVEATLLAVEHERVESLEQLEDVDARARVAAKAVLDTLKL